jgi:hypothetical protein
MELRRATEDGEEFRELERGWCVGSEAFRQELLAQLKAGPEHYGEEIRESGEQKAEGLLESELAGLGWSESELEWRPKGDPHKIRIAQRLRAETTMTLGWIAEPLQMGTKMHLSHLLYWQGKEKAKGR